MGAAGRKTAAHILPEVRAEFAPDFMIAQVENISDDGKGPCVEYLDELKSLGIDFFTGGNHSLLGKGSEKVYENKTLPIVRPANMIDAPGDGYKLVDTIFGKVFVASMLGQTVGSRQPDLANPLQKVDEILNMLSNDIKIRIINFHGDFSSEKRVFGYYLDGRVSSVIGDHWHVPTADAMIMPKGTAHITDVGMCGSLHSSLGVKTNVIIDRWKTNKSSRNEMEDEGPMQFNALLVCIDETTGLAQSVQHIQRIIE